MFSSSPEGTRFRGSASEVGGRHHPSREGGAQAAVDGSGRAAVCPRDEGVPARWLPKGGIPAPLPLFRIVFLLYGVMLKQSKVMLSSSHGAVPSWTDGSDDEYRVTRCCSSFFFSPRDCFHRPGWTTIMLESAEQAAAPTLATTGWGRSALCSEVAQVDVRRAATAAPGADNRTKGEADELEKIKYSTYTVLLTWSILQTSPCQESVWQVIRSASTSHT
ncbi:uncharacterized protein LOC119320217 isoform X2 [Triticum dicoccoides]|uniref:uncharacterized protein LOC119320217 isoform X2 n=1 Tax=Triticum dicoccoides TaxID=85692 RepID=UPI00188EEB42|nr:uncharacterized protein LOC119320217 isoform X2 [Triticum dicoccoides]